MFDWYNNMSTPEKISFFANIVTIITFVIPSIFFMKKLFKKTVSLEELVKSENEKIGDLVRLEKQKRDLLIHNKNLINNIMNDVELITQYDDYNENRLSFVFRNCMILKLNYIEQLSAFQKKLLDKLVHHCSPKNYNVDNKNEIIEWLTQFSASFSSIEDTDWGGDSK